MGNEKSLRYKLDEMHTFIKEVWKGLCAEYDVKVPIAIVTFAEYLKIYRSAVELIIPRRCIEEFIDSTQYTLKTSVDINALVAHHDITLMWTATELSGKPRKPARLETLEVVVNSDMLAQIFIDTFNNLPALKDHLAVTLKHEMGHCLVDLQSTQNGLTYKQLIRKLIAGSRQTQQLTSKYTKGLLTNEEYHQLYFTSPIELEANIMVGLNWQDMYNICL